MLTGSVSDSSSSDKQTFEVTGRDFKSWEAFQGGGWALLEGAPIRSVSVQDGRHTSKPSNAAFQRMLPV